MTRAWCVVLLVGAAACGEPSNPPLWMAPTGLAASMPVGGSAAPVSPAGIAPGSTAGSATGVLADGTSGAVAGPHALMHRPAYPPVPYPAENPNDDNKAMLGKILFWEEQLSGDGTVACGSCHRAAAGGSDPRSATMQARVPGADALLDAQPGMMSDDVRGGLGIIACDAAGTRTGSAIQVTGRKPPTYLDSMFSAEMFWDGRATRDFVDPDTGMVLIKAIASGNGDVIGGALESQAVGPFMSSVEMACAGANWPALHMKLAAAKPLARAKSVPADMQQFIDTHGGTYPALFAAVFGDTLKVAATDPGTVINTRRIAFAVATHERRLTSEQTPWDRWNAGDAQAMTPRQVQGYEVFMGKANCQSCHAPPLFSDFKYHYLGFHPPDRDPGKAAIAGSTPLDVGMMKTPTLRNVGLREPGGLLHQGDGPGHDLQSVITLYNLGGLRADPNVVGHIDRLVFPLGLSQSEVDALIDFLRGALTDPRVKGELPPFDRPGLSIEG